MATKTPAALMALGGVMAALAVVIMLMGTLIPVATYICPMLCMLLLQVVTRFCGNRIGWAWYGAVAILSLLFAPDKEAAAMFVFLGYYPIVKPGLDRLRGKWLWKILLFNGATLTMYWFLLRLMGMERLNAEFVEMGVALTAFTLLLGNVTFYALDRLLDKIRIKLK